ncbi:MAG: di-trans,poly-cis-decaprenylcistransferase [Clostridia bacterium]|jgi:undecaprenyl diphosphate synthase|nr:di-trans,poly-cis-decaprenylcistransferase [Clostridia bacterium]
MGESQLMPRHVGLIMDGNGRWAKKRLMPRGYGHNAGMNRMIGLAERAKERGVRYLTVYTLSTENFSRPKEELEGLYSLFRKYFAENVKKLYKKGAAVKVIGDISVLPQDIQRLLTDGEKNSPRSAEFTLVFAINYGARAEILRAVRLAQEQKEEIDADGFARLLYTDGIPDPDLIIRTGGEKRLSNFLMYQAAYAELYFSDTLFPDFSDGEFDKALDDFSHRERRFGNV